MNSSFLGLYVNIQMTLHPLTKYQDPLELAAHHKSLNIQRSYRFFWKDRNILAALQTSILTVNYVHKLLWESVLSQPWASGLLESDKLF